MNITTLQKCVAELKKESPNIQYILGTLETFIELSDDKKFYETILGPYVPQIIKGIPETITEIRSDETESIPDFLRPGPTGRIGT